jgi:hypothetical protein
VETAAREGNRSLRKFRPVAVYEIIHNIGLLSINLMEDYKY